MRSIFLTYFLFLSFVASPLGAQVAQSEATNYTGDPPEQLETLPLEIIDSPFEKFEAQAAIKGPFTNEISIRWDKKIIQKYKIAPAKIQGLRESGHKGPAIAVILEMAQISGKDVDQLITMKTEQKMGSGAMARELKISDADARRSVKTLQRYFAAEIKDSHRFVKRQPPREKKEKTPQKIIKKKKSKHQKTKKH